MAVSAGNLAEARHPIDVDDEGRRSEAQGEQRYEALTAGEHQRVVPALKERGGLGDRVRRGVVERSGFHRLALGRHGNHTMH